MFEKETPKYQRMLEDELERSIRRLPSSTFDSEEYAKALTVVERLHDMMDKKIPSSVSKETWVAAGTNLLGILLILKHENVNVITSKALGFVSRLR